MLRKHQLNTTTTLTQRYQITENIRVLQIMIPLIVFGTIFDITALFAGLIQVSVAYNTILTYPIYFLITNMYVSVAFYIYMKKDRRTGRRVRNILCRSAAIGPEESVNDINGKPLVVNSSIDMHFLQLESYWRFRNLGVMS
uniref:G protein-coupled receptor n=1 Tax=Acrobeloides nanus TaxID=290746 RepID=A0A914BZ69_9BILA